MVVRWPDDDYGPVARKRSGFKRFWDLRGGGDADLSTLTRQRQHAKGGR